MKKARAAKKRKRGKCRERGSEERQGLKETESKCQCHLLYPHNALWARVLDREEADSKWKCTYIHM